MAAGARLLNRAGKQVLKASGARALDSGGANHCCCCKCSADGLQNYSKTFLVTFSGIGIPTNVCLGGIPGTGVAYLVANVNTTVCIPFNSLTSGGDACTYTLLDSSCATMTATNDCSTYATTFCGASYGIDVGNTITGGEITLLEAFSTAATTPLTFFTGDPIDFSCGSTVVIPNTKQYQLASDGSIHNYGGTATVTDVSC